MLDSHLIARIYDCALSPSNWPMVLQDIADQAGAFGAMVFDRALSGEGEAVVLRMCSQVYDPKIVETYVAAQNALEVQDQARFAGLSSQGDEVNLIRCDDLAPSRAALEGQANVKAMMSMGIYYRAGALLAKDSDAMDRFALQFRRSQGPISEQARQRVTGLLPHVAKSLSIGRAYAQLGTARAAFAAVVDGLPFGVCFVRAGGRGQFDVLYGNSEAARLGETYGLQRGGQLVASRLPDTLRALLLEGAAAHGRFGARPRREGAILSHELGVGGLFIEIAPLSQHHEFGHFDAKTYMISMLDSLRQHQLDIKVLRRFFPMSAAEIEVLELVVDGHTNAKIAEIRGRSLETVNSQVKALLQKSGTCNRTELVRLAVGISTSSRADH